MVAVTRVGITAGVGVGEGPPAALVVELLREVVGKDAELWRELEL
jgi:hypothetical protein